MRSDVQRGVIGVGITPLAHGIIEQCAGDDGPGQSGLRLVVSQEGDSCWPSSRASVAIRIACIAPSWVDEDRIPQIVPLPASMSWRRRRPDTMAMHCRMRDMSIRE